MKQPAKFRSRNWRNCRFRSAKMKCERRVFRRMNSQPRKMSACADTKRLLQRRTVLRYPGYDVSAQADIFRGCEFIRLKIQLPQMLPAELKAQLVARAHELGFLACGVAGAAPSQTASQLETWLTNGYHANMEWMNKPEARAKRADIRRMLPDAKSVVVVAMNYRTDADWDAEKMGEIARYARGDDYHDWMKTRLRELLAWVKETSNCEGLACVDTAPVLEREWAWRAGIGWIGKNSLLMSRAFGSYVLLGELVLDIELPPDAPPHRRVLRHLHALHRRLPDERDCRAARHRFQSLHRVSYHRKSQIGAAWFARKLQRPGFRLRYLSASLSVERKKPSATKFSRTSQKNGRDRRCQT